MSSFRPIAVLLLLSVYLGLVAVHSLAAPIEKTGNLEKILRENIIPYWMPKMIDEENGGYKLNHGLNGEWRGPGPKGIVTQSRMVWYLSSLVRSGYGTESDLAGARHGFRFLAERMWDQRDGGFFWSVDYTGKRPEIAEKHLYGQSFALYGLSEYYLASGDPDALELAWKLFRLLEYRAHDREFGGYREFFLKDWSIPPPSVNGPMGYPHSVKLMNTHLHLMEAFTTFYEATRDAVVRERLIELINIQSNSVVRKTVGACTDRYHADWTPMQGPTHSVASYGHDLENIWLLVEAFRIAGLNEFPFLDLFRTLFSYSMEFGHDRQSGGFFHSGPLGEPAVDRSKIWWVEAEALVSALMMYSLTGEEHYAEVFEKTLTWIEKRQVDWKRGDWFAEISPEGNAGGVKSGLWKSPYHNGRAMLKCLEILKRLE
ncbi:MAG: AGE family epimerase/isomerase [Acidobacteriota bacterium]|nr:MAG: AGE family epimerase/isomerase [Acidobacteriota bacterium]